MLQPGNFKIRHCSRYYSQTIKLNYCKGWVLNTKIQSEGIRYWSDPNRASGADEPDRPRPTTDDEIFFISPYEKPSTRLIPTRRSHCIINVMNQKMAEEKACCIQAEERRKRKAAGRHICFYIGKQQREVSSAHASAMPHYAAGHAAAVARHAAGGEAQHSFLYGAGSKRAAAAGSASACCLPSAAAARRRRAPDHDTSPTSPRK